MGLLPDDRGYAVCNVVWMLDAFTPHNGATRVVPGSHRSQQIPQQVLADPEAPHPEELLALGDAGTIAVVNAHTWHGGTANTTPYPRLAMHSFFCRWDIPQQQYQKKLLRPETQQNLSPELRRLLALDDPYNDEISAAPAQVSGFLK
jgi:ectoine hydroxylase-related dioxygenase (phytanoyl-CoA dioxygenase family)